VGRGRVQGAIRRGDNQPAERTKRRIEDAVRWEHGAIDRIMAGDEPSETPPDQGSDVEQAYRDLEEGQRLINEALAVLEADRNRRSAG
jgi:hypothetical protein